MTIKFNFYWLQFPKLVSISLFFSFDFAMDAFWRNICNIAVCRMQHAIRNSMKSLFFFIDKFVSVSESECLVCKTIPFSKEFNLYLYTNTHTHAYAQTIILRRRKLLHSTYDDSEMCAKRVSVKRQWNTVPQRYSVDIEFEFVELFGWWQWPGHCLIPCIQLCEYECESEINSKQNGCDNHDISTCVSCFLKKQKIENELWKNSYLLEMFNETKNSSAVTI